MEPIKEEDVKCSNCFYFFSVITFHLIQVLKEDSSQSLQALRKQVVIEKASGLLYLLTSSSYHAGHS